MCKYLTMTYMCISVGNVGWTLFCLSILCSFLPKVHYEHCASHLRKAKPVSTRIYPSSMRQGTYLWKEGNSGRHYEGVAFRIRGPSHPSLHSSSQRFQSWLVSFKPINIGCNSQLVDDLHVFVFVHKSLTTADSLYIFYKI